MADQKPWTLLKHGEDWLYGGLRMLCRRWRGDLVSTARPFDTVQRVVWLAGSASSSVVDMAVKGLVVARRTYPSTPPVPLGRSGRCSGCLVQAEGELRCL
jgi:hypothetical protein